MVQTTAPTTIDNTASIDNPAGPDATPGAPTLIYQQSQVPNSGNKILYLHDNLALDRTPQLHCVFGRKRIEEQGNTWTDAFHRSCQPWFRWSSSHSHEVRCQALQRRERSRLPR